ncbi:hypothetical protein WICMUC_004118 [Wickerhamomyces mucosus]|uniref:Inheritance of peroxisomes protein 2 n=1 Tax=Wickerhamomyces mucosus TaxID=1378264 RepID=A0A9P8PIZ8_9ASCO|nr:hypothetical protein WICMUC_004118 [Wickerhamomyces mucosus]
MTDSELRNLFNIPFKRKIPNLSTSRIPNDQNDTLLDFGIDNEDYRSFSSPTLINEFHSGSQFFDDIDAESTVIQQPSEFKGWGIHQMRNVQNTMNSLKCIQKLWSILKRSIDNNREKTQMFFDEFRYMLVTSQLLEETILISNFYDGLRRKESQILIEKSKDLHYGEISKLTSIYHLKINERDHQSLIKMVLLIKHLKLSKIKQIYKKFIIAIILLKLQSIIQFNFLISDIVENSLVSNLKKFISSYQKFDLNSQKLFNNYKELELFSNIIPKPEKTNVMKPNSGSKSIYEIIYSTLTISLDSLSNSLKVLLPLVNHPDLEKFMGIYSINLIDINYLIDGKEDSIDNVIQLEEKFNKFKKLRRLYLVILLSMNVTTSSDSNFTFEKISKIFKPQNVSQYKTLNWKLIAISSEINILNQVNETLFLSLNRYIVQNRFSSKRNSERFQHDTSCMSELTFDLSEKLKKVILDLKTITNIEDFNKIGNSLDDIKSMYDNKSIAMKGPISHKSKRLSLQSHQLRSFTSPINQSTSTNKKGKRLSSGLPIPLVTVFEDNKEEFLNSSVSYDDTYINTTSNNSLNHEIDLGYIDALISNDTSVLISNKDGDTSYEDDDNDRNDVMTNEELKRKLEISFSKLSGNFNEDTVKDRASDRDKNTMNDPINDSINTMLKDESFINELKLVLHKD